ncbi:MAG: polysaccharide deacetylase family protein [Oscillospiraceae bacterium]
MFISFKINKTFLLCLCIAAAIAMAILPAKMFRADDVPAIAGQKTVYLTFDDGPSKVTEGLLDVLAKHDVKATFFVTAQSPDSFESIRRADAEGHLIALHTYTHEFADIYKNSDAFWDDIGKLNDVVYELTGKHSSYLRFPGGSSNSVGRKYGGDNLMRELAGECEERGITYYDWNVDTKDALGGKKPASLIASNAIKGVQNKSNAIVLMHDASYNSTVAEATDLIISELKNEGYVFDTLDHLSEPVHHNLT